MDDGADLVSAIHKERKELIPQILGSMEETTTGVIRLKAMEKDGSLKIPVIAVNDADTKHLLTIVTEPDNLPSMALFVLQTACWPVRCLLLLVMDGVEKGLLCVQRVWEQMW